MNLNFKDILGSVLGGGKKVAGDIAGERGIVARSLTAGGGNRQYERSIRGRSDNFILQFPIVISDGLSMDATEVIRNQVELERSVDISTVISNTPIINLAGSNGYLDGYHNNVYIGNNSPISTMVGRTFMESNDELLEEADNFIERRSLNTRTLSVELMGLSEAAPGAAAPKVYGSNAYENITPSGPAEIDKIKKVTNAPKNERLNRSTPLVSKIKVNYAVKDPNNSNRVVETVRDKEVSFGIKGVVHPVTSQDIIYFLSDTSKRSNGLARLIKLTTGEISFFREFLLNVDRSKKIVNSRNSGVWGAMNSMFSVEKIRQYQKKEGMIPTITLVINVDEVEQIRIKTGIDILSNQRAAAKIFDELFLLDFYVVDEANQIAHKYLPRERSFEAYSLSAMSGKDLNDPNKTNNTAEDLLKRLLSGKR